MSPCSFSFLEKCRAAAAAPTCQSHMCMVEWTCTCKYCAYLAPATLWVAFCTY